MKTSKFQKRFYRDWVTFKDLRRMSLTVKETDLQILTDKPADKKFLKERIEKYRRDIENYISKDEKFLSSLKPVQPELRAPFIVKEMCRCTRLVNVGPMAAVAGAIAQSLGRDLSAAGCKEIIIENGGDIFLKSAKVRTIGIYAGGTRAWKGLSLRVQPRNTPIGICASSGTIGHSLSFGSADSAVILSKNTFLADAAATAVCNRIKSAADLNAALNFARSIKGICGCVLIFKGSLGSWGNSFELCKIPC